MHEEGDAERLAAVLYRGMLRSLPASCRYWFGALRDRGTAVLVEVRLSCFAVEHVSYWLQPG